MAVVGCRVPGFQFSGVRPALWLGRPRFLELKCCLWGDFASAGPVISDVEWTRQHDKLQAVKIAALRFYQYERGYG